MKIHAIREGNTVHVGRQVRKIGCSLTCQLGQQHAIGNITALDSGIGATHSSVKGELIDYGEGGNIGLFLGFSCNVEFDVVGTLVALNGKGGSVAAEVIRYDVVGRIFAEGAGVIISIQPNDIGHTDGLNLAHHAGLSVIVLYIDIILGGIAGHIKVGGHFHGLFRTVTTIVHLIGGVIYSVVYAFIVNGGPHLIALRFNHKTTDGICQCRALHIVDCTVGVIGGIQEHGVICLGSIHICNQITQGIEGIITGRNSAFGIVVVGIIHTRLFFEEIQHLFPHIFTTKDVARKEEGIVRIIIAYTAQVNGTACKGGLGQEIEEIGFC